MFLYLWQSQIYATFFFACLFIFSTLNWAPTVIVQCIRQRKLDNLKILCIACNWPTLQFAVWKTKSLEELSAILASFKSTYPRIPSPTLSWIRICLLGSGIFSFRCPFSRIVGETSIYIAYRAIYMAAQATTVWGFLYGVISEWKPSHRGGINFHFELDSNIRNLE